MGFEESAIKSIKYNHGQLRKKSIFDNQSFRQGNQDSKNSNKPRELSKGALIRIWTVNGILVNSWASIP